MDTLYSNYQLGDVTYDGKISIADVAKWVQLPIYDLNENGEFDIHDIDVIINKILEKK